MQAKLKRQAASGIALMGILLIVGAVATPANDQIELELGVKGGVQLSMLRGKGVTEFRPDSLDDFALSAHLLPSPMVMIFMPIRFTSRFSVQPELIVQKIGERYVGERAGFKDDPDAYDDSAWVRISYEQYRLALGLPVTISFPNDSRITPYAAAGPAVSGLVTARSRYQKYRYHWSESPWADTSISSTALTRRADIALQAAAGISFASTYGSLILELRAAHGLIPFSRKREQNPLYTSALAIVAGFTLGH